jgi:hypothetical protein
MRAPVGSAKQKQIPFGDDRKKGKSNGKDESRFPAGLTEREARAKAKGAKDAISSRPKCSAV